MKVGDLVRVTFGRGINTAIGLFISYDDEPDCSVRAHVFWDGDVYSIPLYQLEVISEISESR